MTDPRRVLVVDDVDDLIQLARMSLEIFGGHTVLTAHTGPEAIAIASAEQPDAILLDMMMPGMDGPDTIAILRADAATRDIPVIFLTANAQEEAAARLIGLGAVGVLTKPFSARTLAGEVGALLGWD